MRNFRAPEFMLAFMLCFSRKLKIDIVSSWMPSCIICYSLTNLNVFACVTMKVAMIFSFFSEVVKLKIRDLDVAVWNPRPYHLRGKCP